MIFFIEADLNNSKILSETGNSDVQVFNRTYLLRRVFRICSPHGLI